MIEKKFIIRFAAWALAVLLVFILIKGEIPLINQTVPPAAIFPIFNILVILEHFLFGSLSSLTTTVIFTFIGFFIVILYPIPKGAAFPVENIIVALEIGLMWVLFALLQRLLETVSKRGAKYDEDRENLEISLNEIDEEINKLPDEIENFTRQYNSYSQLKDISTQLGIVLEKDKLVKLIKSEGEKFIGRGVIVVDMCAETADPVCRWSIEKRYPISIKDIKKEGKIIGITGDTDLDYTSCIAVAIPIDPVSQEWGCIQIKDNTPFSEDDLRLFSIFCGISSMAITNAELFNKTQELAITDGLTGLYVHKYFKERFEEEFLLAKSHNLPLSLVLIDIDHFKKVNDVYGHSAGDKILVQLSGILKKRARETDIVVRYGGEEFAILMVQTSVDGAAYLAEEVRRTVQTEMFMIPADAQEGVLQKYLRLRITISLGVSGINNSMGSIADFINASDRALYDAKNGGRNRVETWNG